ncbi:pyridoxamine 5'-phosphate oxidase family protein [Streptomyces lanatus]|uniref:Pyridoxamine 5'-phosphate oxidase family protein n=1 Tax=Streptomyces lanatus TaxID=66900 RepID=A0ABV1XHL4_9ACTN|nr:pyridoxamine 5'-phosphate oxidase family protein [Streptomyces lanatus]GHG94393.1 hypothetical protein GCM10018780_17620 [Streptomyces lanatus]
MTEQTDDTGSGSAARAIIDGNMYMVLATVGPDGAPWASPVFYSTEDGRDFYWVSSPEVTHSRNLAHEPRVGIVIHDSRAPVGTAAPRALYLTATATELAGAEALEALRVIPNPAGRGGWTITPDEVRAPARWRVYRARVTAYSMICPHEAGRPCAEHGLNYEHRGDVPLEA